MVADQRIASFVPYLSAPTQSYPINHTGTRQRPGIVGRSQGVGRLLEEHLREPSRSL